MKDNSELDVWDKISEKWHEYRNKPIKEVSDFLREQEARIIKEKKQNKQNKIIKNKKRENKSKKNNKESKDKEIKILDLACGSGRNFIKLKSKNSVIYGVDFSDSMLKLAEKYAKTKKIKVKTIKASADSLPFSSNFFDTAIFIASLHCIKNKEERKKALQELKRVLKIDAEAMLSVWSKEQKRFKNKGKEVYVPWTVDGKKYLRYYYLYNKDEFLDLLEKTGFKVVKLYDELSNVYDKRKIVVVVRKRAGK